jgi:hypothetical protein
MKDELQIILNSALTGRDKKELSIKSIPYIWWNKVRQSAIYGGKIIQRVHYYHAVAGYLHPICTRTAPQHEARKGDPQPVLREKEELMIVTRN